MKKKIQVERLATLSLFLLAVVCLLSAVLRSNQASLSIPIPQRFTGEYSRDGLHWQPLTDDARLSALEGDLLLRGHFSQSIEAGGRLYYYQDHIGVTMYKNGEFLFMDTISQFSAYGLALEPSICGSKWEYTQPPDISTGDTVEIRLHNPHRYGNEDAYREFLNTLCLSPDTDFILESYLEKYDLPLQIWGIVLLIAAIMLLGASLASGFLRMPVGSALWRYSLLTLFMGGFIILDTVGISFTSELVVFNTYGRQLCMMLWVYCMDLCLCDGLTGRRRRAARLAVGLSAAADCVWIALALTGAVVIYDTGVYWVLSQLVLCPLLLVCAAGELRRRPKGERGILLGWMLLLSAVLLDIAGVGRSIYSHGTCAKVVFSLLFFLGAAGMLKRIIIDHQASIRAKALEKELADSRIATMLSQIQPHFIYNTLGTIEQLCKEQPAAAATLVHNFSLYLRGNFSELDSKAPILLSRELEHVRHYTDIEQVRFPDMEVRFDLRAEDFLLPALSVQPLVENAIKHGLMGLESGGTVTISSYETETDYAVCVEDDGVGFDTEILLDAGGHIGIQNIRGRIEAMCGGSLRVESTPGSGTRAVITIPKERSAQI